MNINKFSRERILFKILGTAAKVLVVLVNIVGAVSNGHITNVNIKNISTSNKSNESIKLFNNITETNSKNSTFWITKKMIYIN